VRILSDNNNNEYTMNLYDDDAEEERRTEDGTNDWMHVHDDLV
jgi:hypothetical protein